MRIGKITETRKMLGQRIKELRKSAGLTQEELGEKASLNYKFIGELERGRVNVSLDSLVKIATALGVGPGSFFAKDKLPARQIPVKEKNPLSKLSSRELRLIKNALQLLSKTFRSV
jgi:transcriptional regulator with XRE-family HTH domain